MIGSRVESWCHGSWWSLGGTRGSGTNDCMSRWHVTQVTCTTPSFALVGGEIWGQPSSHATISSKLDSFSFDRCCRNRFTKPIIKFKNSTPFPSIDVAETVHKTHHKV
jgi:hypothetical protein